MTEVVVGMLIGGGAVALSVWALNRWAAPASPAPEPLRQLQAALHGGKPPGSPLPALTSARAAVVPANLSAIAAAAAGAANDPAQAAKKVQVQAKPMLQQAQQHQQFGSYVDWPRQSF